MISEIFENFNQLNINYKYNRFIVGAKIKNIYECLVVFFFFFISCLLTKQIVFIVETLWTFNALQKNLYLKYSQKFREKSVHIYTGKSTFLKPSKKKKIELVYAA